MIFFNVPTCVGDGAQINPGVVVLCVVQCGVVLRRVELLQQVGFPGQDTGQHPQVRPGADQPEITDGPDRSVVYLKTAVHWERERAGAFSV